MQRLGLPKGLKLGLYCLLFGIVGVMVLQSLFFSKRLSSSKFADLKDLLKMSVQGVIENQTSHTILVTNYHTLQVIPPGKSSRDLHFYDVDALIIQHPTLLEGTRYQNGVFKFCDFVSFQIQEKNGIDILKPNMMAPICQLLHNYRYFETLRDSCPGNPFGNIKIGPGGTSTSASP